MAPRFAIPDCVPRRADEASREACRTITQVLRADLRFEGLFQFVPDSLMNAIPPLNPEAPRFDDWKGIGAKILVVTQAEVAGGELQVGGARLLRRLRPDDALAALHGPDRQPAHLRPPGLGRDHGAHAVPRRGPHPDRVRLRPRRHEGRPAKELYIIDYDGYNPRRVTVNRSLNILPAWSPDGAALAYVSYRQGSPHIFLALIFEGQSART